MVRQPTKNSKNSTIIRADAPYKLRSLAMTNSRRVRQPTKNSENSRIF
jgi:hypothetical protein